MKWKQMIWIMILNTNKNRLHNIFALTHSTRAIYIINKTSSKRKNSFLGGFKPFLQFFWGIFVIFF